MIMSRIHLAGMAAALIAVGGATTALAQQPQRPPFETTKVEGTDNVYIFRNGNHQSMFIVTEDGVIATDPIAYGRPTGGKAFKDAGAKVIAHERAKERLAVLKDPHTVLPDETVGNSSTIKLGSTT